MRIIAFAYQAVGHACLERILASGDDCVAVITHRDSSKETIWFPSVAALATEAGVAVHYAEDFEGDSLLEFVKALRPDMIYSFYYRHMLPMSVLRLAERGAFNIHGSLLPKYRGRCPVNWVLVNEEPITGVTLHHMTKRPDAGDIVGHFVIPIEQRETAFSFYKKMVPAAAELLARLHPLIRAGAAPRIPQNEAQATYFGGRRPADGEIDWHDSNDSIDALVRAVGAPFPGAFTDLGGRKLMIWEAEPRSAPIADHAPGTVYLSARREVRVACGRAALALLSVGFEGEPVGNPLEIVPIDENFPTVLGLNPYERIGSTADVRRTRRVR